MSRENNLEILSGKTYIAHRGYHNEQYPENSLGAFNRAVENKFHIEMDLHLSKDKQLVVFHDDDMKRVCGIDGKIEDFDYSYLKTVKLMGTNETIPLFDDLLKLVDGKVGLVIELKTYGPNNDELCQKVVERLKKYKGAYVVQSFDPTMMIKIRKLNPEIVRGQLVTDFKDANLSKLKVFLLKNLLFNFLVKPDFINTEYTYYSAKIRRIHKHKPVICWTIRNKDQQEVAKKFNNIIFERFDPRG